MQTINENRKFKCAPDNLKSDWALHLLKSALILFFIFAVSALKSQTIVSGRIANNTGLPVSSASISLSDTLNGKILEYAISNSKGEYKIDITSTLKVFVLQVRAFNYATETRTIPNQSAEYNFTLTPKPTELPNVVVKPNPISQKGDTINYVVSAFADQKDRSIADVLSKIPGIEVQGDGRVLYQGKPIQKYYIEGMDLLEGKYNLANQNLPHQSVSSVQILENHQPIRILDSLVATDRASLNIKLKNNITLTGSGRAGLGAATLLWDAGVTPMLFKKKTQLIASYQANNTGNDVSRQLKSLTLENLMDQLDGFGPASQTLQLIESSTPSVSSKRYLDNNIHLLTGNALTKLKKDLELRINASYLNDAQLRQGYASTIYYTPSGEVALQESIVNQYFTSELNTQFTLQQNTPKGFLKNMLSINLFDNSGRGVVQNTTDTILQQITTPMRQISNQFRWITPIGKQLVTFYSQVHFDNMPHQLNITPGPFAQILNDGAPYVKLQQQFTQTHANSHHFAELTKGKGPWTINPRLGLLTTSQQTDSDAETGKSPTGNFATNDMAAKYVKPYAKATLMYKNNQLEANLSLPAAAHFFTLNDFRKDSTQKEKFITVDPMLFANYKLNATWRLNGMAAYQNSFQNFNQILSGLVVDNYRSIRINNLPIAQTKSLGASFGIFFRNPIKSVFSHAQYQFTRTKQPFLVANRINTDGSREMIVIPQPNTNESHSLQVSASKYISTIKTTLSAGADLSYATGNQALEGQVTQTVNRSFKPNAKINTRLGTVFAFDYLFDITVADNKLSGKERNNFQFISQSLQLHFYPAKNHYIGLMAEHFYNSVQQEKTNIVYPDVTYRFTLPKNRIDFQLTLSNLINEQYYLTTRFTDFYFYQSRFQIRPRQALVSVKFQF